MCSQLSNTVHATSHHLTRLNVEFADLIATCNNQIWTVSLSMGSSNFADITCPWDGAGSKCRTYRFFTLLPQFFDFVVTWGIRFTNTCLVFCSNCEAKCHIGITTSLVHMFVILSVMLCFCWRHTCSTEYWFMHY